MKIITTTTQAIFDAIKEANDDTPRFHFGASEVGQPCERKAWLSFRWIQRSDFDGRMLRLFRRGQNEEAGVVSDLRRAGMKVMEIDPTTRKQIAFKDGHFSGSCDGVITSGVIESPSKNHVLEIKTHSLKSFTALQKDGVIKSKPQHWTQMNIYMGKFEIDRTLYLAVCKNDDHIHTERVKFDPVKYEADCNKAQRIITSDRMPPPLSTDVTWFECKFCDAHEFCHKTHITKEVHCRSCSHVTFTRTGEVYCAHWDSDIPNENQLTGCDAHIIHPDLVDWQMNIEDCRVSWLIDGKQVFNGEKDANTFTSKEIFADPKACANADKFTKDCREALGATIVSQWCDDDIPFRS